MDYEKAYKEALERARKLHDKHPYGEPPQWITCEKIFPELRESEDEKIRRKLIELVEESSALIDGDDYPKMISWLEKQKDIIEEYEDKLDRCACESWDKGYKEGKKECEWSEEDDDMVKETIYFINEFQHSDRCKDENDMQNSVTCENWLKSLKPHWKPTEEQIEALKYVVDYFGELTEHFAEYDEIKSLYNNLKSL